MNVNISRLLELEYSLNRKVAIRNKAGVYYQSSLTTCNTSTHDAFFGYKNPHTGHKHVLMAHLDDLIISNSCYYRLAFHRYPGTFFPQGIKYIAEIQRTANSISYLYQMASISLRKEIILNENRPALTCRYTLEEAANEIDLVLKPLLAFRAADEYATRASKFFLKRDKKQITISRAGIQPEISLGFSSQAVYTCNDDWYKQFVYGLDDSNNAEQTEDLYLPTQLIVALRQGEQFQLEVTLNTAYNQYVDNAKWQEVNVFSNI